MITNEKSIYKRVLIKLSGEVLKGTQEIGIDIATLDRIAKEIKELVGLNVQVSVVIGGGNFFRGACLAKANINRVVGDHMGMLATAINGLAIRDALYRAGVNARLMSAIPLNGVCNNYSWAEAISLMRNHHVVVLCTGTGNPFFTTDSAACLRSIEIEADILLKATKVDGVFTIDPKKNPSAIMYNRLSYSEVLEKELKVMDLAAFSLARDYKLPIRVFNICKVGTLYRVITGKEEGTLIE